MSLHNPISEFRRDFLYELWQHMPWQRSLADTHTFVKALMESGLPENQAEAIAQGIQELKLDELVTKNDLELGLARLEVRLSTRLVSFLAVTVAVQSAIIALIELFA